MKHSRWSYVVVLWLTWFVVGLLNSGVQPVGATAAAAPTERGSVITEVLQAAQPISPDIASQGLLATDTLSETTTGDFVTTGQPTDNTDVALQSYPKFLTLPFPADPNMKIVQGYCYDFETGCGHKGIDYIRSSTLYPKENWTNFRVLAAAEGQAYWNNSTYGKYVMIHHTVNGVLFTTYYGHLKDVSSHIPQQGKGTVPVKRGEQIGTAGDTGTVGCGIPCIHLHFEVHRGSHGYNANLRVDPYDIYGRKDRYPIQNTQLRSGVNHLWTTNPPSYSSAAPRDTTPPDGSITAPTNNTIFTNRNPITISAWATDAGSGVDRVEFMVWRNNVWYKHFVDTTPPYAATWVPNTDVRNGERFILAIHVIDRAGNRRSDAGGWRYLTYQAPSQTLYATRFAAVHSGKVLDVSEVSTRAWQPLHQWDWVNGDNQKFILTRVEGDWYEIKAVHSGLCLDISWASRERGARLIQYYCNRGHNQQFRLYDFGAIQVRHTGMVLDVWDNGRHNGAAIVQWPWHGGNNQRWNRATVTYQRRLALADEGTVGPLQTDPADWQFSDYINQRALSDSSVPADQKAAAVGVATVLDHYGMYTAEEIEQLVERVMPEGQASLHTMQHALAEAGLDTTVVRPTDAATTWSTLTNTLTLGVPVIFYSPPGEMTESGHVIIVKDYIEQDGHQYVIAHDPFGQWQGTCCKDNYAANPTRSTGSQGAWVRYDLALLPNHAQRWLLIAQPQSSATAIGQDPVATVGEFEMLSDDSDLYITGELPIVAVEQSGTGDLEPVSQPPMSVPDEMPETVVPTPTPEPLQIVTFAGATIQSNDTIYLPLIVRGQ